LRSAERFRGTLTLAGDFRATLRRVKPEKRLTRLTRRNAAELPFLHSLTDVPRKLLYDTTVYIDILQDRFPRDWDFVLRAADAWHSPVAEMELAVSGGALDPGDRRTAAAIETIAGVLDQRPAYKTIAPDLEIWREAGLLTGVLARLQGYGAGDRYRVFSDALLFCTARKYGLTVLSRNLKDFDLLQQLDPSGRVVFYNV
jgi:predicted nucleic acid-binding protein